ncbi:Hypothetical predicted protein [Xyrichtys novacula]|uniref:Uncharacterized protein n=1 Tax=Xyrichtys novacula TaxID=13765 RepID=A0AAV1EY61_XYRNO|nr:Hypothetical predicted protein [Xyrichtys novacula]
MDVLSETRAKKRKNSGEKKGECCGVRAFLRMCLCHPSASQIHHLLIPGHRRSVWEDKYQHSALSFPSYTPPLITSQCASVSKAREPTEKRSGGKERVSLYLTPISITHYKYMYNVL